MSLSRNIAANYAGRAYSIAAIYLFVPFYIEILGVEAYGLIAFHAIILSLTALADVGLSFAFSREAAKASDKRSLLDLLTTIEGILLATAGTASLAVLLGADFIVAHWLDIGDLDREVASAGLRLMALTLPFQLVMTLYVAGLLGLQEQVQGNLMQAVYTTARSGLVLIPISIEPDLRIFFGWQIVAGLACGFLTRSLLMEKLGHSRFAMGKFALGSLLPVVSFAGGMLIMTLVSALNNQLDKLAVSKLFNVSQLGQYSLASTLAQIPNALTAPILIALFPKFVSMRESGRLSDLSKLYESYSFLICLLSSIGAFGLIYYFEEIFRLWIGKGIDLYLIGAVVPFLVMANLFVALSTTSFYYGLAFGHFKSNVIAAIASFLLYIPMLYIFPTKFGVMGVAIPFAIVSFLSFVFIYTRVTFLFYEGSIARVFFIGTSLPSLIGFAAMFAAKFLTNAAALGDFGSLAAAGFTALAVCGFLLIVLRIFGVDAIASLLRQ